jgi:hypothetical protein
MPDIARIARNATQSFIYSTIYDEYEHGRIAIATI